MHSHGMLPPAQARLQPVNLRGDTDVNRHLSWFSREDVVCSTHVAFSTASISSSEVGSRSVQAAVLYESPLKRVSTQCCEEIRN